MRKKLLKILGLIILFQSITISNVFAVLSTEIKTRYFMMSINNKVLLIYTILLIIAKAKKKKMNFKITAIYLIWIIYTIITIYKELYIGYGSSNIWVMLYIITILIGIIMIVYTLKRIFEKSLKGDK